MLFQLLNNFSISDIIENAVMASFELAAIEPLFSKMLVNSSVKEFSQLEVKTSSSDAFWFSAVSHPHLFPRI